MEYSDLSFERLSPSMEICISSEHRFGTDAFLLAHFAKARHKDMVCDFCSGSGIVAMLLKRDFDPLHIDALEIQKKAYEQIKVSLKRSGISGITPILGDLKDYKSEKELDLITCNPPYKLNNTGAKNYDEAVSFARHEVLCTIDDVCRAAAGNLKFGGRLCVCNRPERLCDIMASMRKYKIEPKRLRLVCKNENCAPWLVLVEGKKGSKPFLQIEPSLHIQDKSGGYSPEMKKIYGI